MVEAMDHDLDVLRLRSDNEVVYELDYIRVNED